jgi:Short C-terminal domain
MLRRRPLLRAAAVGGGAYLAGKSVARRRTEQQYQDAEQDSRLSGLEQQQSGADNPGTAAAGPAAGASMPDEISKLAELHQQGALSDSEFAAAKAKLLGA